MARRKNRWKGFLLGIPGGIAGLLAMSYYWQRVAPALSGQEENQAEIQEYNELAQKYADVSIYGQQYRENESATAALGRLIYTWITGREPRSKEAQTMLSYQVHWVYGMLQGGVYGAWRGRAGILDIPGGIVFGTGLWLLGDELVVPLLGLQAGPSTVSLRQHLNRLGAHLFYGVATAITTQLLRRMI